MLFENTRKQIIDDISVLSERDFILKYMDVDIENIPSDIIIDDWCGFLIPVDVIFNDLKLDKTLNLIYYNEKLYNGTDNYSDASDFLVEYMGFNDSDNYLINGDGFTVNTYNYDSYLSEILQYTIVYDGNNDKYYLALEVHFGGDARGNYSHVFFFEYVGDIDYIYDLQESCYIYIDGCDFTIDVRGEEASFYNNDTGDTIYFDTYELTEIIPILLKNNIKVSGCVFEY